MNHNSRGYQEHPIAALLGAAAPNIIVAFGFYWLFGIQRKQPKWSIPFLKAKSVDNGKKDDWAFEQAAGELDSGSIEKSIWARAFAECKGDEAASKAGYITLRVERLVSQKVLDAQRTINTQPEPEESIRARKNFKRALVGSTVLAVFALLFLVLDSLNKKKKTPSVSTSQLMKPPHSPRTSSGKKQSRMTLAQSL